MKGVGRRFFALVVFVAFVGDDERAIPVTGTWRVPTPELLGVMGKECTGPVKRAAS